MNFFKDQKILIFITIIGSILAIISIVYLGKTAQPVVLSEVICQPSDLGARYQLVQAQSNFAYPTITEQPLDTYSVTLIDHQLSNTILYCQINRFNDSVSASRAFQEVCKIQTADVIDIGEQACHFKGNAPSNLAFQRNEYLVLMSGDISHFPGKKIDERLR